MSSGSAAAFALSYSASQRASFTTFGEAASLAGDILYDSVPVIRPDASLTEALERFRQYDGERLPVVNDSATKRLIGTIAKTDLILALAESTSRSATVVNLPAC